MVPVSFCLLLLAVASSLQFVGQFSSFFLRSQLHYIRLELFKVAYNYKTAKPQFCSLGNIVLATHGVQIETETVGKETIKKGKFGAVLKTVELLNLYEQLGRLKCIERFLLCS